MQATVTSVVNGVQRQGSRGPYDVVVFTYQPDPYKGQIKEPTTRDVFANTDVGKKVAVLKPGQRVDLTFEKNGRFTNLVDVSVIAGTKETQMTTAHAAAPQRSSGGYVDDPMKNVRIARAVALKEAVNVVPLLLSAADVKKQGAAAFIAVARSFEKYLNCADDEASLVDGHDDTDSGYVPDSYDA